MAQNHMQSANESEICARCQTELTLGRVCFYNISVEAIADPTPVVDSQLDPEKITAELDSLFRRLDNVSASEAMDQVHRRLRFSLCVGCYNTWIENPTG